MEEINVSIKTDNNKTYNIILDNSYKELAPRLKELYPEMVKACIVTDSNVAPLYLESVKAAISDVFSEIHDFTFEAGEESKNLDVINDAYEGLIEYHFNRKDVLIALGGGVTGDMTGYIAATYMRGIDYIQVPTTLLSMVDSSIGGKTGVDYKQYKNMIGAFKMPRLVYINTSCLNTLSNIQFASGMAEVLKAGLLKDSNFYEWTINNFLEINDKNDEIITNMIRKSIEIKKFVVEKDPFEQGDRALLNLGHTVGHAIE